jgi:hypothetical protein
MLNTRDGIARAIEERSPVDIDGTSFTLTELKKSLPHEVKYIEVLFMALSTDARHNGRLWGYAAGFRRVDRDMPVGLTTS